MSIRQQIVEGLMRGWRRRGGVGASELERPRGVVGWLIAHPLAGAVIAGGVARLVAATMALGFHARDDYFHVLEPALRWLADPSFDWDHSDTPGAGLRSHLVPRAVWLVLRALSALGVHGPDAQLRGVYLVVGAYSLLAVPAGYRLAGRLVDRRTARLAAWLLALHPVMPYAGSRLLIEALAIPPLLFGLSLIEGERTRSVFWAGFWVGLACWFRYQVGAAGLGAALGLFLSQRVFGLRLAGERLLALAGGATMALALQGLFDLATTGKFLGPLIANVAYNLNPPSELSRSGPWGYGAVWIALALPPLTPWLVMPLWRAMRRAPVVSLAWGTFVAAHLFVPHKEERFLLPVVPLFLILVAVAVQEVDVSGRLERAVVLLTAAVHAAVLAVAISSQSQQGARLAQQAIGEDPQARGVVSFGPELWPLYLGRELPQARLARPEARALAANVARLRTVAGWPNRFLGFAADGEVIGAMLAAEGYDCAPPELFAGWWLDRLIYRLNPKHNRRRSPIAVWRCEQPALADWRDGRREVVRAATP